MNKEKYGASPVQKVLPLLIQKTKFEQFFQRVCKDLKKNLELPDDFDLKSKIEIPEGTRVYWENMEKIQEIRKQLTQDIANEIFDSYLSVIGKSMGIDPKDLKKKMDDKS